MKSFFKFNLAASAVAAALCLLSGCDDAQPDPMLWAKRYLSSDSQQNAMAVKQTSDKGYILAGTIQRFNSNDMGDVWISKLSSDGSIQWEKAIGGPALEQGIDGMSVVQTQDGGYAFLTRSRSWGFKDENGQDAWSTWVVKLGSGGDILWQKAYAVPGRGASGSSLCETRDGGFLIVGSPVIKIDASGAIQWQREMNALVGIQNSDGSFVLLGVNNEGTIGYFDTYVIKLDAAGNAAWKKNYGSAKIFADAKSIRQTTDSGYIVAGSYSPWNAASSRSENDAWLMKLNFNGDVEWSKSYNAGGYQECVNAVDMTAEGGYIAAGYTNRFDASDVLAVKVDGSGSVVGIKAYDAESSVGYDVHRSDEGNYYLAGYSGSSALLIVANKDGAVPGTNLTIKDIKASAASAAISCKTEAVVNVPAQAVSVPTQAAVSSISSKISAF